MGLPRAAVPRRLARCHGLYYFVAALGRSSNSAPGATRLCGSGSKTDSSSSDRLKVNDVCESIKPIFFQIFSKNTEATKTLAMASHWHFAVLPPQLERSRSRLLLPPGLLVSESIRIV